MNQESSPSEVMKVQVIGYADGVYNLRLTDPETGESENLEITENMARLGCKLLGCDLPGPDSEPPETWG